ncbi:MAG: type 4a pilus biogenesis protein PilO [Steroidobacteraceae bacterium]|jgi:type IV pilus assembly protein PilO|nr:type 4a pilus biogenesis protein PilO [Steroidobacteraceae bacterium]
MNALKKFFEDLQKLDFRDVGRWPLVFRVLAVGIAFVAATGLLVWYFVFSEAQGNVPQLRKAEAEQKSLWSTFDEKQRRAANLEAYRLQLAEIERTFGAMLRQLPGRTEVPSLLVDISQTGLAAGLQENLFQPGTEVRRDFYAELPIKIRLTGGYHEFGEFVSGVAALPRIVTLHDIEITPAGRGGGARRGAAAPPAAQLTLDVTAKTYRYLEESELAEQEAATQRPANRRAQEGRK